MLLLVSTSSDMIFGDTCAPQNGYGYNSNVVILSFESCMWDLLVLESSVENGNCWGYLEIKEHGAIAEVHVVTSKCGALVWWYVFCVLFPIVFEVFFFKLLPIHV